MYARAAICRARVLPGVQGRFLAIYGYLARAPSAFFKAAPRPICRFSDFFF
jgi:hypothetical protein